MNRDPVLIVGGVAAGTSAAAYLKRLKPSLEIILAEQTDTVSFGTCEIPYVLSGELPNPDSLVFFSPEKLAEEKGLTVLVSHKLVSVDPKKKSATLLNTRFGSATVLKYSRLLLATGASPVILPELQATNSFALKSYESLSIARQAVRSRKGNQALIVGAGFIGLELADALNKQHFQVTLVDQSDLILSGKICVKDSELIKTLITENQVRFIGGTSVSGCVKTNEGEIREVTLSTGEVLKTDVIFVAVGFKPNTQIPGLEKLKKLTNGAILVNENMQTSLPDIYAAGDCAAAGKPANWFPLATTASKMGRAAAAAIAGKPEPFHPGQNTWGIQIFDHDFVHTGLNFHQAKEKYGTDAQTVTVETSDRVKIMPGAKPLFLRLNYLKRTGRLVGASQFGQAGTGLRINSLSLAISQKMTLKQLQHSDFLYTPSLSPLWDPILLAARLADKKP